MAYRFLGVFGGDVGVVLFTVGDGFFQRFDAGRYMAFRRTAGYTFGLFGVVQRLAGVFHQLVGVAGLAVSHGVFGMFQRFGGMLFGKYAGAG